MLAITSQRSGKFYLSITFGVLFCLIMALLTGIIHGQATSKVGEVIMMLMSAGLVYGAFYVVVRFYKNAPKITVDKESISFNNTIYYWRDLENVEMTGKRPFKFMGEEREGVLLKFKGQDEMYIFDDMYENTPQIKSFIQNLTIVNNPINQIPIKETTSEKPIDENIIYYKGFQFLCVEGIAFWLFALFFLYVIAVSVVKSPHQPFIPAIFFEAFLFFIFSRRMYHFGLSGNQLIVRNRNFFWYKTIYYLNDIKEIVFEQKNKMPVTLRVINKDFTSQAYPAATIWSKKWMMLKEDLEKKGIKVRNECVHYEPFEFKFFND